MFECGKTRTLFTVRCATIEKVCRNQMFVLLNATNFIKSVLQYLHMGRLIALDVGDVRIGVAASDLMKIIANPVTTYHRSGDEEKDAQEIARLIREKEGELIVCGLPVAMDNSENEQTAKTRHFVDVLKKYIDLPVEFCDERFTSISAERVLIDANMRRKDRKQVIDKIAATIILETYMRKKGY